MESETTAFYRRLDQQPPGLMLLLHRNCEVICVFICRLHGAIKLVACWGVKQLRLFVGCSDSFRCLRLLQRLDTCTSFLMELSQQALTYDLSRPDE